MAGAVPAMLQVRVTPRGGRDRIEGFANSVLRVRLAAPPVEGKANLALVKLLADALGVAPRDVRVVRGATARDKTVTVDGLTADEAHRRLGQAATHSG